MIRLKRFSFKGELTSDNFNEKVEDTEKYLNELKEKVDNIEIASEEDISDLLED